jgi:uncharacterized glyoxalase superfamily protein PhnB
VEATLPGGLRIAWDPVATIHSFEPEWRAPQGSPSVSLAFRCADPAAVDRVYAELLAAGAQPRHEPWDAPWAHRYAMLLDPDGNGIDLFAPLTG